MKNQPIFTSWKNKPLDSVLRSCQELLEDTEFPTVKQWRENGGKVIGHFQVYFPEEIAHAAGALPVKFRGAPVTPKQADSRFGSYLCSILKTSIELALSGFVEIDMFVSHPICDAARNLAAIWGRNFPYPCQILYLPQNANSNHAVEFLKDEYGRLKHEIETVVGQEINDEDLRHSMQIFNRNRDLIRELYRIKRESPWLLSTKETYTLVAIGGLIPREEHNELLEFILPLIANQDKKPQDKIRVVFEGGFCEQPPLDMLEMMNRYCYIVDDDLLIGLRWIQRDIPTEGDPLFNLASAYFEQSSYSPVQHDQRKPKEKMLIERVRNAKADAVIVTAAKMCEPGLEEQAAYSLALEKAGIPHFMSEFEENMTSFDHLEIQLETFVENLLFG